VGFLDISPSLSTSIGSPNECGWFLCSILLYFTYRFQDSFVWWSWYQTYRFLIISLKSFTLFIFTLSSLS